MHSAILKGSDFKIVSNGNKITHSEFHKSFDENIRLGIIAPNGYEGIGALNLILSFVTAFYDRFREKEEDFHIYPDFYSFQYISPVVDYAMFDIYPQNKNIYVKPNSYEDIKFLIDAKIDILLVPEGFLTESTINLKNQIKQCYLYSESGEVSDPSLVIETNHDEIVRWTNDVIETGQQEHPDYIKFFLSKNSNTIVQFFKEESFDNFL